MNRCSRGDRPSAAGGSAVAVDITAQLARKSGRTVTMVGLKVPGIRFSIGAASVRPEAPDSEEMEG